MSFPTHSSGTAALQAGPLQQENERCSFHRCPGHHHRESHTGPLRDLRWTNTAGIHNSLAPGSILMITLHFTHKTIPANVLYYKTFVISYNLHSRIIIVCDFSLLIMKPHPSEVNPHLGLTEITDFIHVCDPTIM